MESGDGLIVRVHPGLGALTADKLRTLVALAERHGNGQIDVTRRANLQLRGISQRALEPLQAALVQSGWAAPSQAGERHFALLASPLLGLASENTALSLLARELERALLSDAAPAVLHPKLCVALDDGERLLRDQPFDLALFPCRDPARVGLAVSDGERRPCLLGSCALADALPLVLSVLDLLSAHTGRPLRMHEWAAATGLGALRAALSPKLRPAEGELRLSSAAPSLKGPHARARSWFGVSFPFGSGSAAQWRSVLALSERFGGGGLLLTPRRELLILDVATSAGPELAGAAEAEGLIWREDDPLSRVSACTGAPLCSAAHGETRGLARALAGLLQPFLCDGGRLHVSGCEKGCAQSGPSALTLVHGPRGVHLARDASAAEAARTPALALETSAALGALAREYATCRTTT